MENTADHLIVIGRGRLIADCSMAEFIARGTGQAVLVRTPQPDGLARAVTAAGGTVAPIGQGDLEVRGLPPARIGDLALASGIALHHLAPARASLEEAFMELTADSVEYHAGVPAGSVASGHGTGA
jgi:ABC-2 type transport system ATP-binding protein